MRMSVVCLTVEMDKVRLLSAKLSPPKSPFRSVFHDEVSSIVFCFFVRSIQSPMCLQVVLMSRQKLCHLLSGGVDTILCVPLHRHPPLTSCWLVHNVSGITNAAMNPNDYSKRTHWAEYERERNLVRHFLVGPVMVAHRTSYVGMG